MLRIVPYRSHQFERSFDNMFGMMDEFFRTDKPSMRFKLDVIDQEDFYLIEAEIPGVPKDKITIDVENDLLYIRVNQKEESTEEKKNFIRRERHESSMERVLRFDDVDLENIQAKLDHGILKINLPKLKNIETKKRIEIK